MKTTTIVPNRTSTAGSNLPAGVHEFAEDIAALGVAVREGVLPGGWWGAYDYRKHEIILTPGLGEAQLRSTLAHELGHAYYRHEGTTPRGEAEARAWSARRLVRTRSFAEAAKTGNWAGMVADELGVMPSDAVSFLKLLSDAEWLGMREMLIMEPRGFGRGA